MEESEAPQETDFFDEFFSKLKDIIKDMDEEACYKEMFRMIDTVRKGFLTNEEFRGLLSSVQSQVQLTDPEIEEVMDDVDKNKDGKVDFSEFYKFMLKE